jgi:acyl-CoA thioesterase
MAQCIMAASALDEEKSVRSIHTVFAKGARFDEPLDIVLDPMATGRTFTSTSVTISQADRVCVRALVVLDSGDEDLINHNDPAPEVGSPSEATSASHGPDFWEIATVGGVDISDPTLVGPPDLSVWTRFVGAPPAAENQSLHRGLCAFATDGFLIGTAMRPHEGVGQSMAHREIGTTVVTHTISFGGVMDAGNWLLLDQHSSWAGEGRSRGSGSVHDEAGNHVADFEQNSMIRKLTHSGA